MEMPNIELNQFASNGGKWMSPLGEDQKPQTKQSLTDIYPHSPRSGGIFEIDDNNRLQSGCIRRIAWIQDRKVMAVCRGRSAEADCRGEAEGKTQALE